MALERKEFKEAAAKKAESSVIQKIVAHPENVMDSYGQRSMGIAINKLSDRYFLGKTDEQVESLCNDTVKELKTLADSKIDANLKAGIEHILTKIEAKPDRYDTVAIYLPVKGTEPLQYKYVDSYFALKQVLTLSWLAIHDDKQFAHHPVNPKQSAEEARKERRERMLQSFQVLKLENPCHVGHRHQLVFPLNKSAIDVDVIADGNTPILKFLKENIYPLFWKKWNDATTTETTKKQLKAALFQWMKENNISELITMVDPAQTILARLKEFFIQHGSDTDQTEKDYDLAIQFANFEPDVNFAASGPLHVLLTAEKIKNRDTYNKAIEKIREWIETQFDIANATHCEWIQQIHALQEAQDLLHRHHLLLILTGKRDAFNQLEHAINTYIDNFTIETLPHVPEEIVTTVNALKEAVYQSKKSTMNDQIENFFAKWYEAQNMPASTIRNERFSLHYSTLLNHDFQTKVRLTDETIQRFIEKSKSESANEKLDIEPYQVNRFFLHAIMTDPKSKEWTDLFTFHLKVVLNFVKNYFNAGNTGLAALLKRDSYPDALIKQIEYLISVREGQPLARPAKMIVLPQNITTVEEWLDLLQCINEPIPIREATYQQYASILRRLDLTDATDQDFCRLSSSIPASALIDYYKSTGLSHFPRLMQQRIKNTFFCVLEKIPNQQIDVFINLLIDEHQQRKLNVEWFTELVEEFAYHIQENTIQKLITLFREAKALFKSLKLLRSELSDIFLSKIPYEDILKILAAGNGSELLYCFYCLPNYARAGILSRLSDEQLCIGGEQYNFFGELTKLLPIHEREAFLIRYCSLNIKIVNWQLADMMSSLPDDRINGFLTYLGEKRIIEIFGRSGPAAASLLGALPETHWPHLFNLLGEKQLNEVLYTRESLSQLFGRLKFEKSKLDNLIARIGNQKLRQIVVHEETLWDLLEHLPDEIVPDFLKINIGIATLQKISFTFKDYAYYLKKNKPQMILARRIAEDPHYAGDMTQAKLKVETIQALAKEAENSKSRLRSDLHAGFFFLNKDREQPVKTKDKHPMDQHLEDQIRLSMKTNSDNLDQLLNLYATDAHKSTDKNVIDSPPEYKSNCDFSSRSALVRNSYLNYQHLLNPARHSSELETKEESRRAAGNVTSLISARGDW